MVDGGGGAGAARLSLRVELEDQGVGRTRVVVHQGPFSPEIGDMARAAWQTSFERLRALLAPGV